MSVHPFFAQIGGWPETLEQPRAQAAFLLSGLGLLALLLLVLMLTRWGQAKPLSKCVALSILAHILLMAYAYGVRLFYDIPVKPREETITVTLVSADDKPQDRATPEQVPPWNRFPGEAMISPELDEPPRRQAVEAADEPVEPTKPTCSQKAKPSPAPERVEQTPETQADEPRLPDDETPDEPAAPVEELPQPVDPPADRMPIEPPIASPKMPAVKRPAAKPAKSIPQRQPSPEMPPDVFDRAGQVQRLTDTPLHPEIAEALVDTQDAVDRSSHESPTSALDGEAAPEGEAIPLVPVAVASASSPVDDDPPTPAFAPRRLGDGRELPATYRARFATDRAAILAKNGGNVHTEAAVQSALAWLAKNQEPGGRWDCSMHGGGRETKVLGHDRDGAGTGADTAVTGLAILAFLGAGHTHLEGDYRQNVQHALEYLLRNQARDGDLAGNARTFARMYCHGIAALALSEAYATTGDARLEPYVARAIQYTIRAQHPSDGGWRYQPGDPGDTSQLGWQLMALHSAELAGMRIPGTTRAGMMRFLNGVSAGRNGGLAGYRPRSYATRTMTAEALVCRLFLRLRLNQSATDEAVAFLMQETPGSGSMNLYYWYYATVALFQIRGDAWDTWNKSLRQRLLATQQTTGTLAGSWAPNTVWGGYGGRVYSTAMAALCLEVYYRYLPLYAGPH